MMGKNNYQDWTKEDLIQEIKRLKKRKKYGLVWEEEKINAIKLANKLRNDTPPIFARIEQDRVLLDMRTVYDEEVDIIARALENIFSS
jgi:seryl-tRNA(Sec) selenium transferase